MQRLAKTNDKNRRFGIKQESLATGRTTLQEKFQVGDSLKYALTYHMDQFVQITFL